MSPKRKRQNKTADEVQALEAVLALGLPSLPKADSDEYKQGAEYQRLDELRIPREIVLAWLSRKRREAGGSASAPAPGAADVAERWSLTLPTAESVVSIARAGTSNTPGLDQVVSTPLDELSSELLAQLQGNADGAQLLELLVQYLGKEQLIALNVAAHSVVRAQSSFAKKKASAKNFLARVQKHMVLVQQCTEYAQLKLRFLGACAAIPARSSADVVAAAQQRYHARRHTNAGVALFEHLYLCVNHAVVS
jgi:hypothetical protein